MVLTNHSSTKSETNNRSIEDNTKKRKKKKFSFKRRESSISNKTIKGIIVCIFFVLIMTEISNVRGIEENDESFSQYNIHSHLPYTTSYNNNDEIHIAIHNQ